LKFIKIKKRVKIRNRIVFALVIMTAKIEVGLMAFG
jgi:hypothetical protein